MDVVDVIGGFGPFQQRIFFITAFRSFCSTFMRYNYNYISRTPDFECVRDDRNHNGTNMTLFVWDYNRVRDNPGMTECYKDQTVIIDQYNDTYRDVDQIQCDQWIYDPTMRSETIVEEWDLVCWNTWLITLGYMISSIGSFCSYIPAGFLADKFGRRPVALLGQILICISTFILGISNSAKMFLAFRFIMSAGHGMLGSAASCLFMETVGPRQRHVTIAFVAIGGFSSILLAAVAYTVQDWRTLVLISSLPIQIPLLFLIWKFMPESTRWLLTAKKYEQAEKQIVEQANINGIKVIDQKSVMSQLIQKIESEGEKQPGSILEVFKNKKVRKVAMIVYITYSIRAIINGGFVISLNQLGGSFYVNMCLLGLIRVLVACCNFYLIKKLNRKKVILCSFLLTGCLFLASAAVPRKLVWPRITLSMLGKLSHGLCSTLLYLLTIEMFPTKVRVSALVGSKLAYRIGHFFAPLTDLVGRLYGKSIPLLIYGVLSIACCLLLLWLPDTKNEQLPDTFSDVERLHRKKKLRNIELKENETASNNLNENGHLNESLNSNQENIRNNENNLNKHVAQIL